MGLDLGTKTIGVALSDSFQTVATPTETIKRKKFGIDAARLIEIIDSRSVGGIVLGLPRNMDGSEWPARPIDPRFRAQSGAIDGKSRSASGMNALSTVAAERALLEADTSRKRSRRGYRSRRRLLYPPRSAGSPAPSEEPVMSGPTETDKVWKTRRNRKPLYQALRDSP